LQDLQHVGGQMGVGRSYVGEVLLGQLRPIKISNRPSSISHTRSTSTYSCNELLYVVVEIEQLLGLQERLDLGSTRSSGSCRSTGGNACSWRVERRRGAFSGSRLLASHRQLLDFGGVFTHLLDPHAITCKQLGSNGTSVKH